MSGNANYAEEILENYERQFYKVQEVNKVMKSVSIELTDYFNKESNIGIIPVKIETSGDINNVLWDITIRDISIEVNLEKINNARSIDDGYGGKVYSEGVPVEEAVKEAIKREFNNKIK